MFDTLQSAIFSAWADGTDLSKVQRLIDAGHDVNGIDADGNTPLISAALVGPFADRSEAATRLLLKHGADPNQLDSQGHRAPLHTAVCGVAEGTVRALLEGGADPNLVSGNGATAAMHAVSELRASANKGSFDRPDSAAGTAAAFVTAHLQTLAAHGADFDITTPGGSYPIAVAACIDACPAEVLLALLDGGATVQGVHLTVNEAPMDLLAACEVFKLPNAFALRLLEAGCPWDVPYELFGGRCFLDIVAEHGPEMALFLAQHHSGFGKAMVDYRLSNGMTALHCAANSGHEPWLTWLVEQGLRVEHAADDGRTPLDLAQKNQPGSVAFLRRLGEPHPD